MKKYILTAVLVLASTSAMADRVVNFDSSGRNVPQTKSEACGFAKHKAQIEANGSGEEVEQYGGCVCDREDSRGYTNCNVDAKLVKKSR